MASRTDRRTHIPSSVASRVTTNRAAKGSVFVNLKIGPLDYLQGFGQLPDQCLYLFDDTEVGVWGFGFRVWGLGCRVEG